MQVKSFLKQYKYRLHIPGDMFEHMVEEIELAFILFTIQRTSGHRFWSEMFVLPGW